MQQAVNLQHREDAIDNKIVVIHRIIVAVNNPGAFVAFFLKKGEVVGIPFVVLGVAT